MSSDVKHDSHGSRWAAEGVRCGSWNSPHQRAEVSEAGADITLYATTTYEAGPGAMAYCGYASRHKLFNPGLRGTNLLEVTLVSYRHDEEYINRYLAAEGAASDHEDADFGLYQTGFCLAIGTFRGLVSCEPNRASDRIVQIHFDFWSRVGVWFALNRNIAPGLDDHIRLWEAEKDPKMMRESRKLECPFRTLVGNAVGLACPPNPMGADTPWGHRYGLLLADNGNSLSWLLDGATRDTVDISGFFDSSPDCVEDGAYATVVGGGSYRSNWWDIRDLQTGGYC